MAGRWRWQGEAAVDLDEQICAWGQRFSAVATTPRTCLGGGNSQARLVLVRTNKFASEGSRFRVVFSRLYDSRTCLGGGEDGAKLQYV